MSDENLYLIDICLMIKTYILYKLKLSHHRHNGIYQGVDACATMSVVDWEVEISSELFLIINACIFNNKCVSELSCTTFNLYPDLI